MIALIAEKPSVAKDIARIIGATQRNDGYLSGNGYMVTWAFGHLIQLAMPEAYGVANFRRESLPILPPDFQLIPRQVKAGESIMFPANAPHALTAIERFKMLLTMIKE